MTTSDRERAGSNIALKSVRLEDADITVLEALYAHRMNIAAQLPRDME